METVPRPEPVVSGRRSAGSRLARLDDLLATGARSYSFEFAPPRDEEGRLALWRTIERIEQVEPTFVSVTYGAGGAMADRLARSIAVTDHVTSSTSLALVAHLTCVGASVAEIEAVIDRFADSSVVNVLALRGDPPEGPTAPWVRSPGGLDHAIDLVRLLARREQFCVGVAAFPYRHPASPSVEQDALVLAAKADAGASFAITQLFFEADAYLRLVDRMGQRGCAIPIIPGIMPVTSLRQIDRFAELSGTPVPRALVDRLTRAGDDVAAVRRIGIDWSIALCQRLLDAGAPGLHFYTLNRSTATLDIFGALDLP